MLGSRSLWVHKRIQAIGGRQGFVAVTPEQADEFITNGWASRVFNPWATLAPPDDPFVDSAAIVVTIAPAMPITTASPVGTSAANVTASGGTSPYTYVLTNDDGGNFSMSGAAVLTARTGLAVGAHTIMVRADDADGTQSAPKGYNVTVSAAQEEAADTQAVATLDTIAPVSADAPVGTLVATINAQGVEPYTITWVDNDGSNFRRSGLDIFTNATPLSVGTHTIVLRVTDADGNVSEITAAIDVTG